MSGDIDQVFTAFNLAAGFLNRRQFLAAHPEIIEYINSMTQGEPPIMSNSDGYRGTSAQNGAYIQYFKDHADKIEKMRTQGGGFSPQAVPQPQLNVIPPQLPKQQESQLSTAQTPLQNENMNIPVQPQTMNQEATSQKPNVSQFEEDPNLGKNMDVPTITNEVKQEEPKKIPDFQGADFSKTAVDDVEIKNEEPIFSPTVPKGAGTISSQEQAINVEEAQDSELKPDESIGIFQKGDKGQTEATDQIIEEQPENLEEEYEKESSIGQEIKETEKKETLQFSSLYDLESFDWWPVDDINLDIKDDHHALMEIVSGSGFLKRSVMWTLSLLDNGKVWMFTADETLPSNEREQILDFEDFKELIESSYM